jgi:hypothetical protein
MAYLGQVDRKASNVQVFNVASSTSATHNIGWTPPSEQTIIVTINGVKQHTNAYSFSGAVLTLSSALVTTDELEVIGINDIGNSLTPVDGSVTTSKLGDDAVTLAKMAGGTDGNLITYDASGDPAYVLTGATTEVLTSNGAGAAPTFQAAASGGGVAGVQVYDSTSSPYTWTKSTRESAIGKTINRVIVEVQGSGGGGGSTVSGWTGGGGGAGGYAMKLIDVSSITTSTVTVGAGGAAGVDGNLSSWADGTNTVTGAAGLDGENGENPGYGNGGLGGAGTGGDLNIEGMNGNEGVGNGQMGGASRFSGQKNTVTGSATNASATNYGHGGYGNSTGGGGLVLVWEIN